jgi:hypothetical protein
MLLGSHALVASLQLQLLWVYISYLSCPRLQSAARFLSVFSFPCINSCPLDLVVSWTTKEGVADA